MTLAQRRKYRIPLFVAIGVLLLLLFFMNTAKAEAKLDDKEPMPIFNQVENVAYFITAALVIAAILILLPLIPFFAPWVAYLAIIIIAIHTLYVTVLRHGTSNSLIPDPPNLNLEPYQTNQEYLTISSAPWA